MRLDEYLKTGAMTVAELRHAIGAKSDAQVRQWQHGYAGRKPGHSYCMAIEAATKGVVRCEDLRPDVNWSVLRGAPVSRRQRLSTKEAA